MAPSRNSIEIVVTARDEATKQIQAIFDQFGKVAVNLAPAAEQSARFGESLLNNSRAISHVARLLGADLDPGLIHVAAHSAEAGAKFLGLAATAAGVGAAVAILAIAVGTHLVKSFEEAKKAKEELQAALESLSTAKAQEQVSKLADEIRKLGRARDEIAKQLEKPFPAPTPSGGTDAVGQAIGVGVLGALRNLASFRAAQKQTAIDKKAADEVISESARKSFKLLDDLTQAEIDAAKSLPAALDAATDALRKFDEAASGFDRSRFGLTASLEKASAEFAGREAARQAERAVAAKQADAEILESRRSLQRAILQSAEQEAAGDPAGYEKQQRLISQAMDESRAFFAERMRLSEEETALRVEGIERQTDAALKGAQAELDANRKILESLKKEPLFNAPSTEGIALRTQAATVENQAKILQDKLTDLARQGASDRAKAEEEGLKQIRQLRVTAAQDALADLNRALAAEKAARDQARTDAQGLLARATASLQEQGVTSATGAQLQAEAAKLAGGDANLLNALRGGGAVDLSKLGTALSSQDQLARFGGNFSGLIQTAAAPSGPFRGPQSAIEQEVQRQFLASGGTLPEGGLFRNPQGQEGPTVGAARARLAGAQSALSGPQQAAKESVDLVINTLEADGTPRIIVIGEKFAKAFTESFTQHLNLGKMADALDAALADVLTFMGQRGTR